MLWSRFLFQNKFKTGEFHIYKNGETTQNTLPSHHFTIHSLNIIHNLTQVSGFLLNIKAWNKEQRFCPKTLRRQILIKPIFSGDNALLLSSFWDLCSLAPTHPFSSFWDLCGLAWFSQGVVWPHPSPQSWLHPSNLNFTFFKSEFFSISGGKRFFWEVEGGEGETEKCNTGGKKRGE